MSDLIKAVEQYIRLRQQLEVSIVNWGEVVMVRATHQDGGLYVFGRDLLKEEEGVTWAWGWDTTEAKGLRTYHGLK